MILVECLLFLNVTLHFQPQLGRETKCLAHTVQGTTLTLRKRALNNF